MVRLKVKNTEVSMNPAKFQFQDGTIKRQRWIFGIWAVSYFNSKMVRLKVKLIF